MSGEISYLSRFFVKFVEISAAGLASAICAYLLAHFGGLLSSSPTPASAPASTTVQIGPTASEVTGSRHAQTTPPAADAAVNKQGPAPQQDTDSPVVQPGSRDVPSPVTPVDIQSRPVAAVDPLSPRADPPLEISAPQQPPTADQDNGVFSALKRIPDLLRPEPPAPTGETPRPPMPVGTASPEIREFGN